jgi:hypothetical protein
VWKIDVPGVGWHIGTLRQVAEITQVTLIDHLRVIRDGYAVYLQGLALVNQVEKRREGIAEADTAPTAVADIVDAREFAVESALVPELRIVLIERMSGRRVETAFST